MHALEPKQPLYEDGEFPPPLDGYSAAEIDPRARIVLDLLGHLDRVVSGVQVGITLTSLGLGALGEATLAALLSPLVANIPGRHTVFVVHAVSLAVAFILLTIVHVVLGELVPKS